MFLITKGTTDTWGIGLMETLCKVVEALIDTRLHASLQLHDVLHRFWSKRGMEMSIMELKLAQDISSVDTNLLFLILL